MNKRLIGVAVGLMLVALAVVVPAAVSQIETAQPVYTYVSQFQVARANWAQFTEESEKTFVPIAEKFMADGTLVGSRRIYARLGVVVELHRRAHARAG